MQVSSSERLNAFKPVLHSLLGRKRLWLLVMFQKLFGCLQFHLSKRLILIIHFILMAVQCQKRPHYPIFYKNKTKINYFYKAQLSFLCHTDTLPDANGAWKSRWWRPQETASSSSSCLAVSALIRGLETYPESLWEVKPRGLNILYDWDSGQWTVNCSLPLLSPVALMMDCKGNSVNRRELAAQMCQQKSYNRDSPLKVSLFHKT